MYYIKFLICSIIFWGVLFLFCSVFELFDKNNEKSDNKNEK